MPEDTDTRDWRVVTDRESVRELAEEHDAVPMHVSGATGGLDLRVDPSPDDTDGERLTWVQFYERLEETDQVVRFRPPEQDVGTTVAFDVVSSDFVSSRDTSDDRFARDPDEPAAKVPEERTAETDEARSSEPTDVDYDKLATGDTGDAEPVEFDETETDEAAPNEVSDPSTSSTSDASRAPTSAAAGLVVDEIHEQSVAAESDLDDEYVAFANEGEEPIDLSGWVVENDAGRSYRFPSGYTLHPGNRVTLHTGDGEDTGGHLHWNADEPVWDAQGDTITVTNSSGDRVLREPYEA